MIKRLTKRDMKATIKDIAKRADTSIATVSNVLSNKDMRVSASTRKRVLSVAKELNYSPNVKGVNLKKGCTNLIAVIVGDLLYPFYAKLLKQIGDQLRPYGKSIVVCDIDNNYQLEKEHYQRLATGYVDGAIIIPSPITQTTKNVTAVKKQLSAIGIPVVIVAPGAKCVYPELSTVETDAFQSAYIATEYLLSLGHTEIGFVSEMKELSVYNARYSGYVAALKEKEIEVNPRLIAAGYTRYTGGHASFDYLRGNQHATMSAVLCSSDMLAIGFNAQARMRGYDVPTDISIIGMDNILATEHNDPKITTVNQDVNKLASLAIEMLLKEINSFDVGCFPEVSHLVLSPSMVYRESCAEKHG